MWAKRVAIYVLAWRISVCMCVWTCGFRWLSRPTLLFHDAFRRSITPSGESALASRQHPCGLFLCLRVWQRRLGVARLVTDAGRCRCPHARTHTRIHTHWHLIRILDIQSRSSRGSGDHRLNANKGSCCLPAHSGMRSEADVTGRDQSWRVLTSARAAAQTPWPVQSRDKENLEGCGTRRGDRWWSRPRPVRLKCVAPQRERTTNGVQMLCRRINDRLVYVEISLVEEGKLWGKKEGLVAHENLARKSPTENTCGLDKVIHHIWRSQ